jgi:hypothetical protein
VSGSDIATRRIPVDIWVGRWWSLIVLGHEGHLTCSVRAPLSGGERTDVSISSCVCWLMRQTLLTDWLTDWQTCPPKLRLVALVHGNCGSRLWNWVVAWWWSWLFSYLCYMVLCSLWKLLPITVSIRGRIQKFPDWPPGARTANGTALYHYVQLYRCFVCQSSGFCRHNTLCCSQLVFIVVSVYFVMTQSGNFWIALIVTWLRAERSGFDS